MPRSILPGFLAFVCAALTGWAADIEFSSDASGILGGPAVIQAGFVKPGTTAWVSGAILPSGATVAQPQAWLVEAVSKKKPTDIQKPKFTLSTVPRRGSTFYQFQFTLDKPYDASRNYIVKLAPGFDLTSSLLPGWRLTNPEKLRSGTGVRNTDEAAEELARNKALQSNFKVQSGKDSTLKLTAAYNYDSWQGDHWADPRNGRPFVLRAKLEAEGTYKPSKQSKYLKRIEAELNLAAELPSIDQGPFRWLSDIGLASRLESDQYLKDIDGSAGIGWWNAINGDLVQSFGKALCLAGEKPANIASPTLSLAYDWVFKLNDDIDGARHHEDITQRVRAELYWSVLLMHQVRFLSWFGHDDPYNATLVLDVGGSYDFTIDELVPDLNVSLEVSPPFVTGKEFTFFIAYENGKTRSKFENYQSLLAGFKLPF